MKKAEIENDKFDDFTKKYLKQLGQRIKELRLKKGYSSYEQFAYEHEISRSQIGRYENGQDLRISSLFKLLQIFEISFLG